MPHRMLVESIIINNCSIFAEQYQPFEMIYYRLSEQYRTQQEEFFSPCCQILHPYWMPVVFMFDVKRGRENSATFYTISFLSFQSTDICLTYTVWHIIQRKSNNFVLISFLSSIDKCGEIWYCNNAKHISGR